MTAVLGIDAGTRELLQADHLARGWAGKLGLPDGLLACTHFVRTPEPHVAVSLRPEGQAPDWAMVSELAEAEGVGVAFGERRAGPAELAETAAEAAARTDGRAVLYPGARLLTGDLPVAAVLAESAIDRIVVLGGQGEPAPATVLRTRDHVRPDWRDGALSLAAAPAAGGVLVPFEVPDPTPCCGGCA